MDSAVRCGKIISTTDRLNEGPSLVHWFGVDSLGRDIFSRVLVGAQISLAAGVLAVLIGAAIGTVLGLLAGYYEGWWDRLIMRLCDVLFAFPGDPAGDRGGRRHGQRDGQRDHRRGDLLDPGVCSSGARQYAGSEGSRPLLNRRAASAPATPPFCSTIFCRGRCHRSWFISPCALGYRLFRRPVCRFSASAHSRPPRSGARCSTRRGRIW